VTVLCAYSAAVSEGAIQGISPANVIFTGIGVFLSAAKDVAASKDVLAELFERIGFAFERLEAHTEVTPTAAMTDMITEIMVEVLTIFGIATKELRRGSAKKFLKKLAGRNDLEDSLKKLYRLTQELSRMALTEYLRLTESVLDEVKVVDGVEHVEEKVEDVGDKVEDIDDKVKDIGDKVRRVDDGEEAGVLQLVVTVAIFESDRLIQLLRVWLSPSDPSTNHHIARNAQHEGTAVWLFQGSILC